MQKCLNFGFFPLFSSALGLANLMVYGQGHFKVKGQGHNVKDQGHVKVKVVCQVLCAKVVGSTSSEGFLVFFLFFQSPYPLFSIT